MTPADPIPPPVTPPRVTWKRPVEERERLRQLLLDVNWHRMDSHELIGCPLCGAAVNDPYLHTDWHLRNLQ